MNYIKEAENYLRYYRELYKSVEHAEYMIQRFTYQTCPGEISAVYMEVTGVRAAKPIHTLNQIYQLQKWQEIRDNTLVEIDKIESTLQSICQGPGCERYRDILYMWYVEKLPKWQIAETIGYSDRHVRRLKQDALKKFIIILFGTVAIAAM
jgi:hypothetical protein